MDLSIIIRVSDDLRIKNCIKSIDEEVEIVIVLNKPTKQIRKLVNEFNATVCEINEKNLAKALNEGIKTAKYNKILLMDSDCEFEKGTIKKLYNGLKTHDISKGRVVFRANNWWQNVIARSREYHVSDIVNAYCPAIAVKKKIIKRIGGHYYDERLFWMEDHEFDQRVQKGKIKINYFPDAVIYHAPLTAKSDLKSSFNYGTGCWIGVSNNIITPSKMYGGNKTFLGSLKVDLKRILKSPYFFKNALRKKGMATALYLMVWMLFFSLGYYDQMIFGGYKR